MTCCKCGSQMRYHKPNTHGLDHGAAHAASHAARHPATAVVAGVIWAAGKALAAAGVGGRHVCPRCGHSE